MAQQFLNPKIFVLSKINKYIKNAIKINRDWYLKQNAIPRKIPTNTNAVIDFCFLVAKYSEIKIKKVKFNHFKRNLNYILKLKIS